MCVASVEMALKIVDGICNGVPNICVSQNIKVQFFWQILFLKTFSVTSKQSLFLATCLENY